MVISVTRFYTNSTRITARSRGICTKMVTLIQTDLFWRSLTFRIHSENMFFVPKKRLKAARFLSHNYILSFTFWVRKYIKLLCVIKRPFLFLSNRYRASVWWPFWSRPSPRAGARRGRRVTTWPGRASSTAVPSSSREGRWGWRRYRWRRGRRSWAADCRSLFEQSDQI